MSTKTFGQLSGVGFSYPPAAKPIPITITGDEAVKRAAKEEIDAEDKRLMALGMSRDARWAQMAVTHADAFYKWRHGTARVLDGANTHALEKSRQAKFQQLLHERETQFANESSEDRWNAVALSDKGRELLAQMK